MKYLPVQGKSISDFLPGYQDDSLPERPLPAKAPMRNQTSYPNVSPTNTFKPRTDSTPSAAPLSSNSNYDFTKQDNSNFTAPQHSIDLSQDDSVQRIQDFNFSRNDNSSMPYLID
jgi:hypothetical protein